MKTRVTSVRLYQGVVVAIVGATVASVALPTFRKRKKAPQTKGTPKQIKSALKTSPSGRKRSKRKKVRFADDKGKPLHQVCHKHICDDNKTGTYSERRDIMTHCVFATLLHLHTPKITRAPPYSISCSTIIPPSTDALRNIELYHTIVTHGQTKYF